MPFDLVGSIPILRSTPGTLRAMLEPLSPAWSHANDGAETWSPFDILGHLIHGERTDWIPRAALILDGGKVAFTPFDMTAHFQESAGKSLADLLDEFATLRAESLATLTAWELTTDQLEWTGVHPEFGTVTLAQLLATWVAHDLGHVAQVARVMARQYRHAVGPWRKYLTVLDHP